MTRLALLGLTAMTIAAPDLGRAQASPPYDGYWAKSRAECRGGDGPSSRTFIDSRNKLGPILDQYENHCRIRSAGRSGAGYRLALTCHEFWDDFRAGRTGRAVASRITMAGREAMTMDGAHYIRCKP